LRFSAAIDGSAIQSGRRLTASSMVLGDLAPDRSAIGSGGEGRAGRSHRSGDQERSSAVATRQHGRRSRHRVFREELEKRGEGRPGIPASASGRPRMSGTGFIAPAQVATCSEERATRRAARRRIDIARSAAQSMNLGDRCRPEDRIPTIECELP
jgi:hypothetical protein